jgi:hypothetical protein
VGKLHHIPNQQINVVEGVVLVVMPQAIDLDLKYLLAGCHKPMLMPCAKA